MIPGTLTQPQLNAIANYAMRHDALSDEEQILVAEGRYDEAEDAHNAALIAVRAWQNEIEDKPPLDPPFVMCSKPHCPVCG